MTLIDRAIAAIAQAREAKAFVDQEATVRSTALLAITGDPAAIQTLTNARGARALWEPKAAPGNVWPVLVGRFAGVDVLAVPSDVVADRTVLNVLLGARIVARIDFLATVKPAVFLAACRTLWGVHWRSDAMGAFDVPDRTLRRWLEGKSEIPVGIARALLTLIDERRVELTKARDEIARLEA